MWFFIWYKMNLKFWGMMWEINGIFFFFCNGMRVLYYILGVVLVLCNISILWVVGIYGLKFVFVWFLSEGIDLERGIKRWCNCLKCKFKGLLILKKLNSLRLNIVWCVIMIIIWMRLLFFLLMMVFGKLCWMVVLRVNLLFVNLY